MFPVGFRFPSKEGEASRLSSKKELPCCFLLSMTCRDGSACAPGTVSASARRKSLRTGLTPSGASKGCASIPVRGVCSSCMPTTKPSGPRSCCWRWPLRNSLPGMSPCAAKTSPSQPEGRVGGLFSAISLSGRSCRFSSGWPRRWRPPFPLSSKGLRRCAVGASVWMSLMPPPSAFPCCAVTSKRHAC